MKPILVQWHGLTSEENSWEDVDQLVLQYPYLDLEDKVLDYEGGIVILPVKLVNKGMWRSREVGSSEWR